MTLASGAAFKIGDVEVMAASHIEPHYLHTNDSLFASTQAIAGEVSKDQLHPERILWSITDWIGGEGATVYYPQNPTQYDVASLMNVTKRGQLTTRTERRRSAVARAGTNADGAKRSAGGSAYVNAFIAWEDNIVTSADCVTWTTAQDATPNMSAANFSDAISDGTNIAFLPNGNATASNVIPVVSADASTTTWADADTGTAIVSGTDGDGVVGAVLDGVPYTFAQDQSATSLLTVFKKAAVMDTAADWAATTVFVSGIDPVGAWGTSWWTSCVAAEQALYVSYSTKTHCFIWEIRDDVGAPFWTGDPGFVGKKLLYKSGILFVVGNNQAAGNSYAALVAIPLSTLDPQIVAEPRKHQATSIDSFGVGCAGNGDYLFLGDESSGKIFLYDIRNDALSLFDDLVNGGTGDGVDFVADADNIAFLAMHGSRLFTATYNTADTAVTTLQVISWDDLEVQSRDNSQAISASLETATWDFGLPMELKGLIKFTVNFKVTGATTSGLVANSRITVSYSADDATYVDLTTITSATTPKNGVLGTVEIAAPTGTSTVQFSRLKIKIALDNNATAVAPPILYSVVVEAQPMAYTETWDLAVMVEPEAQNERPSIRANVASYIRDALEDLVQNKDIVTFLDGYRYERPAQFSTHTVRVETVSDEIIAGGVAEGVARVRLRSVA